MASRNTGRCTSSRKNWAGKNRRTRASRQIERAMSKNADGEHPPGAAGAEHIARLLFAGLLLISCLWILHLPLFPTQDGPVHVYYAQVTHAVLSGQGSFGNDFRAAHSLPPYAVHAYLLMFLM